VTRLNAIPRPGPAEIDLWVSMFYRSCKTYRPAYRAACHYGQAAIRAAGALRAPAIYMATAEDMLFPHLDRLPPLKPGQRIERLSADPAARIAAITGFVQEFAAAAPAPPPRHMAAGGDFKRRFIDGPHGQIFVRQYGDPSRPPLFLLHDAPGTGLALHETAVGLAAENFVIVPDQPGSGLTEAPQTGDILAAAVDNVFAVADAQKRETFSLAAFGCGGAVAARIAQIFSPRVTSINITARLPADIDPVALAPELPLCATGAHWLEAWLMLRDAQIYRPWYDGRIAAQLKTQGNFDAAWLHDQTVALMEGRATYHLFPRAAAEESKKEVLF